MNEGQWFMHIMSKDKTHQLGPFETNIEAAIYYDEAAVRLHGSTAVLNYPEDDPAYAT